VSNDNETEVLASRNNAKRVPAMRENIRKIIIILLLKLLIDKFIPTNSTKINIFLTINKRPKGIA
jgi:hypothetical protein